MCMNSYSIILLQIVHTYASVTIPFKCPPEVLWKRRASTRICEDGHHYHCLLDAFSSNDTHDVYIEACYKPNKYIGLRHVESAFLTAKQCQQRRFSPFPFWSNERSDCPFLKSFCTEEGQVTVYNGSSRTDRACRCNYKDGYDYIIKPRNKCKCEPFIEDCSCYIKKCSLRQFISQDYECTDNMDNKESICNELLPILSVESNDNIRFLHNTTLGVPPVRIVLPTTALISFSILLLCAGLLCIICHRRNTWIDENIKWRRQKEEKSNIVTIPDKIYIQDMIVADRYYPTHELQKLEHALCKERRNNLVILEGVSGSGKTELAHNFCKKVKEKYSIIVKVALSRSLTFKEVLENLADDMKVNISHGKETTTESIIRALRDFFNFTDRFGFPYLLFVDNIDVDTIANYKEISSFVSLKNEVQNLDMILSTTDQNVKRIFKKSQYDLIHLNGMREEEYCELFASNGYSSEKDIHDLVKVIGRIPLVLITAIHYMDTTNQTPKSYREEYDSKPFAMYKALDIHTKHDRTVLQSQEIPITYIKDKLKKKNSLKAWKVFKMIPYLRFREVSRTVLEACYYHLTKCEWDEKKTEIDDLIQIFTTVSFCSTTSAKVSRIRFSSLGDGATSYQKLIQEEKLFTELTFHEVTMHALEIFKHWEKEDNRINELTFLLKMFCHEIDIDARTDITVYRNMQFVRHAIKVIKAIEKENYKVMKTEDADEMNFYVSYLHCAIGSTYLFERTKAEKAHFHMMRARKNALLIVNDFSQFTKDMCTYQQRDEDKKDTKGHDIDEIKRVSEEINSKFFREDFVKDFILGKRRNQNDVDVIEKEVDSNINLQLYTSNYLSEDDYNYLCGKKLALPLNQVSEFLLSELILRILHNNGRALNELRFITHQEEASKSDYTLLRKACFTEFSTADAFRCNLESHLKEHLKKKNASHSMDLFSCLESKRSGKMLMRWSQHNIEDKQIDEDIEYFEKLSKEPNNTCFDFGIVKMTGNSNTRHIALCHRILLRYHTKKHTMNKTWEEKRHVYEKGKKELYVLQKVLKEMESGHLRYSWLSMPSIYIQCGKFLVLSNIESDTEEAFKMFKYALEIEESRQAFWTRFTFQGYMGKIQCLRKLNRKRDALDVTLRVKSQLMGLNRDKVLDEFASLEKSITNDIEGNTM